MIKFSEKNQAFYDMDMNYVDLPNDLVDVDTEQHLDLLTKINSGHYIFSDLSCSGIKPSPYHIWKDNDWIDERSDEEKRAQYLASLKPLTRRQFKLALLENGLLDQIENSISAIEDDQTRARIQIEYTEATEFHRMSDSVMYMCQLLNLTGDQVDQMWKQALSL